MAFKNLPLSSSLYATLWYVKLFVELNRKPVIVTTLGITCINRCLPVCPKEILAIIDTVRCVFRFSDNPIVSRISGWGYWLLAVSN